MSAREALLRASNYYRTAEFFLREHPATDPEVQLLSARSRETFAQAAALLDNPVVPVSIPYEGTTLPGYLFLIDDSGSKRPTVGAAALSRGYNVLAFDGPGQGAALRVQGLVFRPDWEKAVSPVVDFALTRPEIDPAAIALFGYSLGGLLVARAAAYEQRVAALILDDGIYDFYAAFTAKSPSFFIRFAKGQPQLVEQALTHAATTLVTLTAAEGAGEHCHMGALTRARRRRGGCTRVHRCEVGLAASSSSRRTVV